MAATLRIKSNIDVKPMMSNKLFPKAQEKAAIQMLDWMSNGSSKCPLKPPRLTGVLASSGSVFINAKLLGTSPNVAREGMPTPNKSHSGKGVTWGFNTAYARRLHENKLNPGPFSVRDAFMHPGNQWVTAHLQKDKDIYTTLIAKFCENKMK